MCWNAQGCQWHPWHAITVQHCKCSRHMFLALQKLSQMLSRTIVRLSFSSDPKQFYNFSMSRASRRPMRLSHVKPVSMMINEHFNIRFMGFSGYPFTWTPKVGRLWKMPKSLGTSEMLQKPWRCPSQIPRWSFECLFLAKIEFLIRDLEEKHRKAYSEDFVSFVPFVSCT